jgi:hypothetical protein
MTFRGTAAVGTVEIDGTYGPTPRWRQLASVRSLPDGTYQARIHLTRRGLLHLRVLYADGSKAVGSVRVR